MTTIHEFDEHAARDPILERYSAYYIDRQGVLTKVCSGPSPESIGLGLCEIGGEELAATGKGLEPCGIIDHGEPGALTGRWLVLPWPEPKVTS